MIINNNSFLELEIPEFNPLTQRGERVKYWRGFKRKCMEGLWVSGKWMPGELFFYLNAWHIEVGDKGRKNAGKIMGRPWFRDLEWEKAQIATEAFGFSGFEDDTKNTCFYKFAPENIKDALEDGDITQEQVNTLTYIKPWDYIRMNHGKSLGKPLYLNPAKNVIDVEARGGGKSYFASGLIGHNFLLDGSHDYDEYMRRRKAKTPMVSQTLVGAIQASYSSDLLNKFSQGVKYLPGQYTFYDEKFPSPLAVSTAGTLQPGEKPFLAVRSGSKLHHRTFQDKAYAAAGTRPYRVFLEEIGFFHRLIESLGAMKDLTYDGDFKQGCIWMFGTGGDMEGGSTLAAQEVFYNPEAYDCLVFEDEWEGRGKIGYFVPAEKAMNGFKEGPNMVTNMDKAAIFLNKSRDKAKKANRPDPYNDELQNRPRKPSEAFLAISENKFPIKDLEIAYTNMTEKESQLGSHWTGLYRVNEEGKLIWDNINSDERPPLRNWPVKAGPHLEGCIEIFEMPKKDNFGEVTWGRYIAGTDPVDDDDYEGSLQSTFVMDLFTERIVAEYTARTYHVEDYWENTRLMLMAYNAVCNYESQKKGFYGHMKQKTSLHLLCDQPEILRDLDMASIKGDGNKLKGTYATTAINLYARKLYNIWLKKQATAKPDGVKNATIIRSVGLLQESINYNPQGNFDRVSAAGMLFILHADKIQSMDGTRETINEAAAGLAADPFFTKNYDRYLARNNRGNLTGVNQTLRVA